MTLPALRKNLQVHAAANGDMRPRAGFAKSLAIHESPTIMHDAEVAVNDHDVGDQ
jgi:hypothetical protein